MNNVPDVKLGIVAVSRDCFEIELSRKRRVAVVAECAKKGVDVVEIETIIENESDVVKALQEIDSKEVNAINIFLGNFGPEGPSTLLAQKFDGPAMISAAAEESGEDLFGGRGDAYCGVLNTSYSVGLRGLTPYIPEYPVGVADDIADMMADFTNIARVIIGVKKLKIFAFGPRPHDFLACNAPIRALFDLGVEVMENSELDMLDIFKRAAGDKRIANVVKEMEAELGSGNQYPDLLQKLAQHEVALTNFAEENRGMSEYVCFANKCWPAFETNFGFVPCYVNSRLAGKGMPVSCEVDIYGALSEYMITCATGKTATLLDINNTVPQDMYQQAGIEKLGYTLKDTFMGFHCGNTCSECMANCSMKYQLIMHRLIEPGKDPDITRGTLEGTIRAGDITLFRLQSTADTTLRAYVAEGEVLDVDPRSFGAIGVFAIKEMGRFYRHVLIQKRYPHHAGIGFSHAGKTIFAAAKMLGVSDVAYNQPRSVPYPEENPFG